MNNDRKNNNQKTPEAQPTLDGELTEQQLESIVGGWWWRRRRCSTNRTF